jgi:four helix bundle protein
MDKQDLKRRTRDFAIRIMNLVDALPQSVKGRAIGNQLVRSGTAVGANYRACCRSWSKAEFIAKLGVVEEEADESAFWLELIIKGGLLSPMKVQALLSEPKSWLQSWQRRGNPQHLQQIANRQSEMRN